MQHHNHTKPKIYGDHQVREAIQELFSYEDFLAGMKAFVPPQLNKLILDEKDTVQSADDFQKKVIRPFLKTVAQSSISNFTFSGTEHLSPSKSYLFVSNHRDIVLDSAYLNMVLLEQGMRTSQIAIGDNLVANRLTELLFKINKSFVVKRSGNPREIYNHAVILSQYIKETLTKEKDSVWIAQREGRAKDGNDKTQISLLKMLSLSSKDNLVEHFKSLNITPVSISYEYDPCGYLKTKEYLKKKKDPNYKKVFHDDAQHLLLGIKGHKGHVHFHFEKPLHKRLDALYEAPNQKGMLLNLAGIIDKAIHLNYQLHPINYYAYDQLLNSTNYSSKYAPTQASLKEFFDMLIEMLPLEEQTEGREFMLKIYANPLSNKLSYG
ncbi:MULTISPECIES: 1-acyl-sn-glycerol-3-phosphate acyltransferase [unclassified Aureispira]|uniref:1-acyl-sn-glycerol-3-phosphate acyltransferase n=1 Tax=unclassified Aureispira TaxID=2649989 RepID=UPI000696C09E|nr:MULTISPECIES: 1-acyl-sn-glycerol-3-phosphate acyltransferase [unclassified Aureispira]WMX12817.1 1-acyl-sn-glycerol-3-phosphate acyltransferase [Aureispira sp. CCB-E]